MIDASRGEVELAPDVRVGPFAVLIGPLRVGPGSRIGASAIVGASPKKRGATAQGRMVLGAGVDIGEGAVLDAGTTDEGVGIDDQTMILPLVYLGHDAQIGRSVTIASHARVGGRVVMHEGANIGLGAAIHPSCTIGAYAIVGMQAAVSRDVPPLALFRGVPARMRGMNSVGATRAGFSCADLDRARAHHEGLRAGRVPSLDERDRVDALFVRFLASSRRGG